MAQSQSEFPIKYIKRSVTLIIIAFILGNGGCNSDNSSAPVTAAAIEAAHYDFRVGENTLVFFGDDGVSGVDAYSLVPDLPAGLSFDVNEGVLSGEPTEIGSARTYTLTKTDGRGAVIEVRELVFTVRDALPAAFESLDTRYSVQTLVSNANIPVRMALTPDGRLLYNELLTGNIRMVSAAGQLAQSAYATIEVETGAEKGLLGLAVDPRFSDNGYTYAYATVSDDTGSHAEVIRLTEVQQTVVNREVIVDDLPVADFHNGGDIVFDKSEHLFIGRGDVNDPASAQSENGLSGRVLRVTREGAVPEDNPFPGSTEWSRGLRNTFALAVNPVTGDLIGADAGPANDDKLNYLQPGKNFTWGMEEEPGGNGIGFTIKVWEEVITPTGLFFHSGSGIPELKNQLFLASYNDEEVRRIVLAGERYTDYLREIPFAAFKTDGLNNKPLHIVEGADGSVYVSTFNAIYRLYRH